MLLARRSLWCAVLALSPLVAVASTGGSSKFTTSEPTNIPGLTLHPGSYSIQVVDHLSERYVVRVEGPGGRSPYSFLALENSAIPKPAKAGEVLWSNPAGGKQYVRGWLFPGTSSVLEFVYPKAEAVAIAKSNQAKGLSKSDLQLVTLWLLSATHVGPGDASGGIQAERYPQVAVARKPVISKLPQTASNLPWIALMGALSILTALAIRFFRPAYVRSKSWE
jgi:LPXTG-motif cell wall-anchored protein